MPASPSLVALTAHVVNNIHDGLLQTRAGADRAKADLNGAILHDLELKLGWGKSVQLPPVPLYSASTAGAPAGAGGPPGGPLGKPTGAAVPPPGVEAAPPWVAPPHGEDSLEGVGGLS